MVVCTYICQVKTRAPQRADFAVILAEGLPQRTGRKSNRHTGKSAKKPRRQEKTAAFHRFHFLRILLFDKSAFLVITDLRQLPTYNIAVLVTLYSCRYWRFGYCSTAPIVFINLSNAATPASSFLNTAVLSKIHSQTRFTSSLTFSSASLAVFFGYSFISLSIMSA